MEKKIETTIMASIRSSMGYAKSVMMFGLSKVWGSDSLSLSKLESPPCHGLKIYSLGGTPHPVIVTIRDNRDYIRVLLYSYYTTITGWGVLLIYS